MANQALEMFFKKLSENEEFLKKVFAEENEKEDIQKLAKEEGIELSLDEVEQAKEILIKSIEKENEDGELSDDDLEDVAGGGLFTHLGRIADNVVEKGIEVGKRIVRHVIGGW